MKELARTQPHMAFVAMERAIRTDRDVSSLGGAYPELAKTFLFEKLAAQLHAGNPDIFPEVPLWRNYATLEDSIEWIRQSRTNLEQKRRLS